MRSGWSSVFVALGALAVTGVAVACGGGSDSSAGLASGSQATTGGSSAGGGTSSAAPTTITVTGGPNGTLMSPGAACIDLGGNFQVAITGEIGGSRYLLKFDAPGGTTDLSAPSAAGKVGATVYFAPLSAAGGGSWGANPQAHQGSGSLIVDGTRGGSVVLHLVPSSGSAATTPLDLNGTYSCATGAGT